MNRFARLPRNDWWWGDRTDRSVIREDVLYEDCERRKLVRNMLDLLRR